ncbi:MAG: PhzF family phenazine biosynthesis protein [Paracoccaceae bacterium]
MSRPLDWVDAFAERPFAGNACAVVHDAGELAPETRMALVRETSLSECAFVVPSETADFGARYYLADREIPMAGHPTVATAVSLVHRGAVDVSSGRASFTLELPAGVLPIEVTAEGGRITVRMIQPRPEFLEPQDPAEIAAVFGLSAEDVEGVPRIVSTGNPFCVTLLRSPGALRRARLDPERLQAWRAGTGLPAAALMEPFLSVIGGEAGCDVFSRLLLPPPLPAEDPFTGSATGSLAAYLSAEGRLGPRFVAGQGDWMGRPGRAEVEVIGPAAAPEGIAVAGAGVVLMSGELRV